MGVAVAGVVPVSEVAEGGSATGGAVVGPQNRERRLRGLWDIKAPVVVSSLASDIMFVHVTHFTPTNRGSFGHMPATVPFAKHTV